MAVSRTLCEWFSSLVGKIALSRTIVFPVTPLSARRWTKTFDLTSIINSNIVLAITKRTLIQREESKHGKMDFFPSPSNRSTRVLSWIPLSPFNSVVFDSHVGRVSLLVQVQANLQRASSELFFTRGDHDGAWWNSIVRVVKYAASFGTREKMRDEYYLLLVAPSR